MLLLVREADCVQHCAAPDRDVKSDLLSNVSSQVAIWDLRFRHLNHNIVPANKVSNGFGTDRTDVAVEAKERSRRCQPRWPHILVGKCAAQSSFLIVERHGPVVHFVASSQMLMVRDIRIG